MACFASAKYTKSLWSPMACSSPSPWWGSWEYESAYFCLSSVWSMNLSAFKNFVLVYFKCLGVIVLYSRLINPKFSIYDCQVCWKILYIYILQELIIYTICVCINYILIICIINCCRIKQLVQSQYELGASGFFLGNWSLFI